MKKQPFKKKAAIAEELELHPATLATILKNKEKLREQFYSGTERRGKLERRGEDRGKRGEEKRGEDRLMCM